MNFKKQITSVAFGIAALAAASANAAIVTSWRSTSARCLTRRPSWQYGLQAHNQHLVLQPPTVTQTLRWGTRTGQGQSGLDILDSPANTDVPYRRGCGVAAGC